MADGGDFEIEVVPRVLYQGGRKYAGGSAVEINGLRAGGGQFKLVARLLFHE